MATKTHQHALVLSDVVSHGLKAGQILQASPDLVKALARDGSVDPAKEAVEHARSQGATVVRSCIEAAAEADEQRAAAADKLQAEIAELEAAVAKAQGDAKAAAEQALVAKRAELAALAG